MAATAAEEFRQSWRIVLSGWIGAIFGQNGFPYASFGVLVQPIALAFGLSVTAISGWVTFYFLGGTVASPLLGLLADRVGGRCVVVTAIPCFALIWVLASLMRPDLWMLYTIAFFCGSVAIGASPLIYSRVINTWFTAGRGTALGIMSAGIGLSYSLTPIVQRTVDRFGWRSGFLLISGACLIPWTLTLPWLHERRERRRTTALPLADAVPTDFESGLSVSQAIRFPVFWLLGAGLIMYGLGAGGVTLNMVPFLTASGLSRISAAWYVSLLGIFSIAGRVITGFVIDRLHAGLVCCAVLVLESAAFIAFATTGSRFAPFAVSATGFAFGGEVCCIGYLVARYFGVKHYSTILGLLSIVSSIGVALGPPFFSMMHERSGAYAVPFSVAAVIAAIAAGCFGALRLYSFFPTPAASDLAK